MSWTPFALIQTPGTDGDTNYPSVDMDAVDKAAMRLKSTLIHYSRARLLAGAPNANYTDSCKNLVTVSGAIKTAVANINGLPAINNPGTGTTLGTGPSYQVGVQMPPSFTYLTVVNPGTLKDGDHLLTTSASDFEFSHNNASGFVLDCDGTGSLDGTISTGISMVPGTPLLAGCSFDAATKTVRLIKGSAIAVFSAIVPAAYPATTGAAPQPLSFYSNTSLPSYDFNGSWAVKMLFNKAYGAGGNNEFDFAALVQAIKAMYAV